MEHVYMVKKFKPLEKSGLKGFLGVWYSVFEGAVIEFFANAKVLLERLLTDLSAKEVAEMKMAFSCTGVPFRPPNKKMDMKVEYRLLHDIMAKALCVKAGSFDVVTSEKCKYLWRPAVV
ncbi:hypothetical protein F511_32382 [Dorcoceras hygrometricum]|uniref:Uncharacterized protein n=1 Tax=Dorcoceras hygrometricum TaxID=472368 RepID=A0A2Z7C1J0_9LAMI|nr:hypothetical protein F511_32382 [Dorcoceras hygrometricum]